MSKAVLISIQPKWCELIAKGKKTIEVRKSIPKLEVPFKVYIYCTIGNPKNPHELLEIHSPNGKIRKANGKVIGEFICDTFVTDRTFGHDPLFNGAACMSEIDAVIYSCQSSIYGWHISDLKIYDKPRELSEFSPADCGKRRCFNCECFDVEKPSCTLKRPPQSWCYVEEDTENA